MFYYDPSLNSLAANKTSEVPNGAKDLKSHSDKWMPCGNHHKVVDGIMQMYGFGYFRGLDHDVTLVAIPGTLLFFHKNLEETKKFLEFWKPKLKAKVPENVLVKMIMGRFVKLDSIIKESNTTVERYKAQNPKSPYYVGYDEVQNPEFRTVEEIEKWVEIHGARYGARNFMSIQVGSWWTKFKKEICTKPELKDSDISSATDLMISYRIMSI